MYAGLTGVEVLGKMEKGFEAIVTPEALSFLAILTRAFREGRDHLLEERRKKQSVLDRGDLPGFDAATKNIRESDWVAAPPPSDLMDRRVEITGPASSRKMVINALNSGAKVYMADSEDSESPTWRNIIQGQINLRDAVRGTIDYQSPEGKEYRLNEKVAVLMYRPRGLHLLEKHVLIDGRPIPASIFDFGLYFFHNARELLAKGTGLYFYLPKLESHLEARLWNKIFNSSEEIFWIKLGSIRATVLIETILAAFEMNEIIYELRAHSAGLNCGRWDYIFSFIKKFRNWPDFVLPDRAEVTMDKGFLKAYSELLIQTCHRRGVHAMGGMAAQIPIKNDPSANESALEKVRADKLREVKAGHDGTWVAHPGLVSIAQEIFDTYMPAPNQLFILRNDVQVEAADLLRVPEGLITEKGLRINIRVAIQYLESWLRGNGCVPINNLMEDAATAEISRAQVWQWLKHSLLLNDGRPVTKELVEKLIGEELEKIMVAADDLYDVGMYQSAIDLFRTLVFSSEFEEFLTLPAYEKLLATVNMKGGRSGNG